MSIGDILAAIWRALFGKKSPNQEKVKQYTLLIEQASDKIRRENTRLHDHKREIERLQHDIKTIIPQLNRYTGDLLRINKRQLKLLFLRLDNLQGVENAIFGSLRCWELIRDKAKEARTLFENETETVDENVLGNLLDDLGELNIRQKMQVREEERLRGQRVTDDMADNTSDEEFERRMREYSPAVVQQTQEPAPIAAPVSAPAQQIPVQQEIEQPQSEPLHREKPQEEMLTY
ncbi:MAG: hypothetical protein Q4D38_07865 [Planctomycetia bacterium]|nr:hypothetical protein [Planctomycetia bacterium]